mmetsp:Transcript_57719/g.167199  ORF Transcript_57719/g.167199 Transcript_57719/m.167199 type:complete len:261 (+) Transcript_57719:1-783(+)
MHQPYIQRAASEELQGALQGLSDPQRPVAKGTSADSGEEHRHAHSAFSGKQRRDGERCLVSGHEDLRGEGSPIARLDRLRIRNRERGAEHLAHTVTGALHLGVPMHAHTQRIPCGVGQIGVAGQAVANALDAPGDIGQAVAIDHLPMLLLAVLQKLADAGQTIDLMLPALATAVVDEVIPVDGACRACEGARGALRGVAIIPRDAVFRARAWLVHLQAVELGGYLENRAGAFRVQVHRLGGAGDIPEGQTAEFRHWLRGG